MKKICILVILLISSLSFGLTFKDGKQVDGSSQKATNMQTSKNEGEVRSFKPFDCSKLETEYLRINNRNDCIIIQELSNKYEIKSLNNIYSCNKPIICFSNKMKETDNQIKFFLNNKMYNNKYVLKKTNEGKKIIKSLFNKLNTNPKKYIRNDLLKTGIKERVIADFIAGMTDRFAINLNRNFK